jgi:hypothetical protein
VRADESYDIIYNIRHRAGNRLIASSNPTSARRWRRPCGVAWDAVPEPMVEYIDPGFYNITASASMISYMILKYDPLKLQIIV